MAGVKMELSKDTIRKLMQAVKMTRDEELTCGHCYEELDQFIEMKLKGKHPEEAMPLVQEHLDICPACREEYEVLLEALKKMVE
jgi:uncharacterized protein with PIN domain